MRHRLPLILATLLFVVSCGAPEVNLLEPLGVKVWSPHNGARDVEVTWEPGVCLSAPVDADSLIDATLHRDAVDGELVTSTVAVSEVEPSCVTFRGAALEVGTNYFMVLGPTVAARDGTELGQTLTARFRTVEE